MFGQQHQRLAQHLFRFGALPRLSQTLAERAFTTGYVDAEHGFGQRGEYACSLGTQHRQGAPR
ncbi:Uncharacterised protein [Ewingella americana]|uniref:Uncharacterized protein n=1 Tax=Ewingella americana TaxID=41202 RepID=A0A377TI43_9GAMM|nr:Uncharacterised protein [Ewingella americana]